MGSKGIEQMLSCGSIQKLSNSSTEKRMQVCRGLNFNPTTTNQRRTTTTDGEKRAKRRETVTGQRNRVLYMYTGFRYYLYGKERKVPIENTDYVYAKSSIHITL